MALATRIHAITLFEEDLEAARRFYGDVLGLELVFETDDSAVYGLGETVLNLLDAAKAPGLVAPLAAADGSAGARSVFTVKVDDVDAAAAELERQGVEFVYGPRDQPWGIRAALFRDPGGHLWELSS